MAAITNNKQINASQAIKVSKQHLLHQNYLTNNQLSLLISELKNISSHNNKYGNQLIQSAFYQLGLIPAEGNRNRNMNWDGIAGSSMKTANLRLLGTKIINKKETAQKLAIILSNLSDQTNRKNLRDSIKKITTETGISLQNQQIEKLTSKLQKSSAEKTKKQNQTQHITALSKKDFITGFNQSKSNKERQHLLLMYWEATGKKDIVIYNAIGQIKYTMKIVDNSIHKLNASGKILSIWSKDKNAKNPWIDGNPGAMTTAVYKTIIGGKTLDNPQNTIDKARAFGLTKLPQGKNLPKPKLTVTQKKVAFIEQISLNKELETNNIPKQKIQTIQQYLYILGYINKKNSWSRNEKFDGLIGTSNRPGRTNRGLTDYFSLFPQTSFKRYKGIKQEHVKIFAQHIQKLKDLDSDSRDLVVNIKNFNKISKQEQMGLVKKIQNLVSYRLQNQPNSSFLQEAKRQLKKLNYLVISDQAIDLDTLRKLQFIVLDIEINLDIKVGNQPIQQSFYRVPSETNIKELAQNIYGDKDAAFFLYKVNDINPNSLKLKENTIIYIPKINVSTTQPIPGLWYKITKETDIEFLERIYEPIGMNKLVTQYNSTMGNDLGSGKLHPGQYVLLPDPGKIVSNNIQLEKPLNVTALAPEWRAFLDAIAWAEGTFKPGELNSYDHAYTYRHVPYDLKSTKFPGKIIRKNGISSSAWGRYQALNNEDWNNAIEYFDLQSSSPHSQDMIAYWKAKVKRKVSLPLLQSNPKKAFYKVNQEWVSIPKKNGEQVIHNQGARKIDNIIKIYNLQLKYYKKLDYEIQKD